MSIKTLYFYRERTAKTVFVRGWESGNYPDKLVRAMRNSSHVISAWDDNKLIGLVRALDDRETVAFLHYLLVDPAYQGHHIGDELMKRIMSCFLKLPLCQNYACLILR